MYVYNTTNETQVAQAFGNYFTFKPGEKRRMKNDDIAKWIGENRLNQGLVTLGEEFEDGEYATSEAGKKALEHAKETGLSHYISALRSLIYNNQVSLRQDLEKANIKADPAAFASKGELEAMRLLAQYQKSKDDDDQAKIDEVRKLMKEVGPVSK